MSTLSSLQGYARGLPFRHLSMQKLNIHSVVILLHVPSNQAVHQNYGDKILFPSFSACREGKQVQH